MPIILYLLNAYLKARLNHVYYVDGRSIMQALWKHSKVCENFGKPLKGILDKLLHSGLSSLLYKSVFYRKAPSFQTMAN